MTRKFDLGQIDFHEKRGHYIANLLEQKHSNTRFHTLWTKCVNTWHGRRWRKAVHHCTKKQWLKNKTESKNTQWDQNSTWDAQETQWHQWCQTSLKLWQAIKHRNVKVKLNLKCGIIVTGDESERANGNGKISTFVTQIATVTKNLLHGEP